MPKSGRSAHLDVDARSVGIEVRLAEGDAVPLGANNPRANRCARAAAMDDHPIGRDSIRGDLPADGSHHDIAVAFLAMANKFFGHYGL